MRAEGARRPRCMEDREWSAWRTANATLLTARRAISPCVDCLTPFAEQMVREGSCDGVMHVGSGRPRHTPERLRAQWREASRRLRARSAAAGGV
jgi:hypothetical protein